MKRYFYSAFTVILSLVMLVSLAACEAPAALSTPTSAELTLIPSLASVPLFESPSQTEPSVTQEPSQSPESAPATESGSSTETPANQDAVLAELSPQRPVAASVAVQSILFDFSSQEIVRGETFSPIVVILPLNATDKSFSLSSGNENVLRQKDGIWTAVGAGTAQLTATASNGVTGKMTITVTVPVLNFSLGASSINMYRGEFAKLTPVISPDDATDIGVQFTSSDESVVSISEDGTIHGVGAGTAVIEGTIGGVSATSTVTVTVPVADISITADKRRYMVGDLCSLTVQLSPQDATDQSYEISFEGAAATLNSENTFFCISGGELIVTVTAANSITGSLKIIVVDLAYFAGEVFRLTNIERVNEGLPPLSEESSLTRTAVVRANEIISLFSHKRPDGSKCFTAFDENGVNYGWAGENIGMGQSTPAEVVKAWMDSPGHRENILKAEFNHLGVGVAMDGNGKLYWAQNFTD